MWCELGKWLRLGCEDTYLDEALPDAVDVLSEIWLADADAVRADSHHIAVLLVQCYVNPFRLASPD